MAESEYYSFHNSDSNVHNDLSACENFTRPALSHSIFRSVTFREFKSTVNNWEITHNNLNAEESIGTRHNATLTPMFGSKSQCKVTIKKIINQNVVLMNRVYEMSDAEKNASANGPIVSHAAKDSCTDTSNKSKHTSSESHENVSNVETSSKK